MRIAAGSRRGARLAAPPGRDTRPTAARTRQALFDMLDGGRFGDPYRGRLAVDAFAGAGALGLEALSRGASRAVFLERAPAALAALRRNIRALGFEDRAEVVAGDATRPRRRAPCPAGLVLLDPPYGSGLAAPCLEALRERGWIGPETLAAVELAAGEAADLPARFEILEERRHGAARLAFARLRPGAPAS